MLLAIGVSQIIRNIIYKILWLFSYHSCAPVGNIASNIFEPSNGGNGIKLNTPSPTFIEIVYEIIVIIIVPVVDIRKVGLANL